MSLIPENKIIEKDFEDTKIWGLIHGKPMVGKTTFANSFPEPLFFNTDGNTQSIDRDVIDLRKMTEIEYKGQTGKLSHWKLFRVYVDKLVNGNLAEEIKAQGYKTIVFDNLDNLKEWARKFVLDRYNVNDESEDKRQWSPIYKEVRKEFMDQIHLLLDKLKDDFNLLFLTYQVTETINDGLEVVNRTLSTIEQIYSKKGEFDPLSGKLNLFGSVKARKTQDAEGNITLTRFVDIQPVETNGGGNRFNLHGEFKPSYDVLMKAAKESNHKGEK